MTKFLPLIFFFFISCCPKSSSQIKHHIPSPQVLHDQYDTISVHIIGDVMMHSKQFTKDHRLFFAHIKDSMLKADISIANMEFSLAGKPYSGYPAFSSPEYIADYMAKDCGTDVFLTANNHILDKGTKGIKRTLQIYDSLGVCHGIKYTGSALNEKDMNNNYPLIIDRKGIRLALINFSYGSNLVSQEKWPALYSMNREEVFGAFQRAKGKEADFIICLPHWGIEYQLNPSKSQKEWAEWMVEQGADVIVGSHPHVVQDSTHIQGVPVIYSLGNAVSNMSIINSRVELAVTLRFVVDRANGEKKMLEPQLDFMWCTLPGTLTDSYSTIYIKEWAKRRDAWLNPSDYDNMIESWKRVKNATGIED